MIIILTFTIVTIVILTFGATYSWYAYKDAQTNVSGNTIKEVPTVIFSQTEYIKASQNMPIYDEDRYNYANKNSFTITVNENLKQYEVGIEISLINIVIDPELKIKNYKYELLQDDITVASGDFSNIGNDTTLKLLPMTIITPNSYPKTYNYELYIWLSEDNTNQNNLMNKNFGGKINVNSAIKK